MSAPAVSVVLPVGPADLPRLAETVTSILNQTMGDLELLVVIDGPFPQIAQVLGRLGDARVRAFALDRHRGWPGTVNDGVARATAPTVAVTFPWHVWATNKLEKQLAAMTAHVTTAVFTGARLFSGGGQPMDALPAPWSLAPMEGGRHAWLARLFGGAIPLVPGSVLTGKFTLRQFPFDPRLLLHGDRQWLTRLLARHEVVLLPEPLVDVHAAAPSWPGWQALCDVESAVAFRAFLSLTDVDDLLAMFPHLADQHPPEIFQPPVWNDTVAHFFLAREALATSRTPMVYAAWRTLFTLLGDEAAAAHLRTHLGYHYPSFFRDAQTVDVFGYAEREGH